MSIIETGTIAYCECRINGEQECSRPAVARCRDCGAWICSECGRGKDRCLPCVLANRR